MKLGKECHQESYREEKKTVLYHIEKNLVYEEADSRSSDPCC